MMNKTDKITMPGFSAETSLYQASRHYHSSAAQIALAGKNAESVKVEPSSDCDAWAVCCFFGNPICCQIWTALCFPR